jgi:ubiquinone/menaquinone biosynthesis C-methylase UbiE
MGITLLANLRSRPDAARALDNYRRLAPAYDSTCTRIESLRQRAVRELKLRGGETVFDIGCGTGATLPMLALAVGPTGKVVGIEPSPEMAALARRRVDAAGRRGSVEVIESALETLWVDRRADALLLCYTHDVLQSPPALDRLIECAKPGARIVVLGMRTLPWLWGWPANLFNLYRARRYLTTFRHLRRPWQLLEERGVPLRLAHSALWGSGYIAVGSLPDTRPMRFNAALFTPRSLTPQQAV